MKNAIKLGRGEPCWNEEGTRLSLIRFSKKGMVSATIRPRKGFKGRDQEYDIYAVPVR
jgi:hypothetical protein